MLPTIKLSTNISIGSLREKYKAKYIQATTGLQGLLIFTRVGYFHKKGTSGVGSDAKL